MVRVNLIDVTLIADQHLIAEHHELEMIIAGYRRSLRTQTTDQILSRVPPTYRLGTGHALFFFDKLDFLIERHRLLTEEGIRRGFAVTRRLDVTGFDIRQYNDYTPTPCAVKLSLGRILDRLYQKPEWYRWNRVPGATPLLALPNPLVPQ